MEPHQKDIVDYIEMVCKDKDYIYPKFIPVSLPRRLGKTTIAQVFQDLCIPNLIVVDRGVERDEFNELLFSFRTSSSVLVVLFTPQDETDFSTCLLKHNPIIGKFEDEHSLMVSFPDGKKKSYTIGKDIKHLSTQKEAEIRDILNKLTESLESKITKH